LKLETLATWCTRPTWVGGAVGLALALFYGKLTSPLPEGSGLLLLGLVAVVVGINSAFTRAQQRYALRVLRALGQGRMPRSAENLRRALQEVRSLPGRCFLFTLQGWLGGRAAGGGDVHPPGGGLVDDGRAHRAGEPVHRAR
jgi:hypothetical protein